MPFSLAYDGAAPISSYFLTRPAPASASSTLNGEPVELDEASFRGRAVFGASLALPNGYTGVVLDVLKPDALRDASSAMPDSKMSRAAEDDIDAYAQVTSASTPQKKRQRTAAASTSTTAAASSSGLRRSPRKGKGKRAAVVQKKFSLDDDDDDEMDQQATSGAATSSHVEPQPHVEDEGLATDDGDVKPDATLAQAPVVQVPEISITIAPPSPAPTVPEESGEPAMVASTITEESDAVDIAAATPPAQEEAPTLSKSEEDEQSAQMAGMDTAAAADDTQAAATTSQTEQTEASSSATLEPTVETEHKVATSEVQAALPTPLPTPQPSVILEQSNGPLASPATLRDAETPVPAEEAVVEVQEGDTVLEVREDDEDDLSGEKTQLVPQSRFSTIKLWYPDAAPDVSSDVYARAINEWIPLALAASRLPPAQTEHITDRPSQIHSA